MKTAKIYASKKVPKKMLIDMTLSINPLGCSPKVLEEFSKISLNDIRNYPDDRDLRKVISRKFKIKPSEIVFGSGSEQLIKLIAQTFTRKGDLALIQKGSFGLFTKEIMLTGCKCAYFDPLKPKRIPDVKLVMLSNPSTPTGEVFSINVIKSIIRLFPDSVIVIDEANGEFINESAISFIKSNPNVIVLKTFSKVLGLAGIRIGFAIGKGKIIKRLSVSQQPFAVSSIACKVVPIALNDELFIKDTLQFFSTERMFLSNRIRKLGLDVSDSFTNNLFISGDNVKQILLNLNRLGIAVVDNSFFPGLDTIGFRISIRDKITNRLFLDNLKEIVKTL